MTALCTAALRPSRATWARFVDHLRKLESSGQLSSDEITAIIASDLTENLLIEEAVADDSDAASITEVIERVKATYRANADTEIDSAKADAAGSEAEAQRVRRHVLRRAQTAATVVSWAATVALVAAFVAGTALGIADIAGGSTPSVLAILLAIVPLAVASLAGVIWGWNANESRRSAQRLLSQRVQRWMLGE